MIWMGVLTLVSCIGIRLVKQRLQRLTLLWALLAIAYTVGFHIGIALVLIGVIWG